MEQSVVRGSDTRSLPQLDSPYGAKEDATMGTAKVSRFTVRVVVNVLVSQLVEAGNAKDNNSLSWSSFQQFELVSKEFTHNAGLKRAIAKFKKEDMVMTDENTVEVNGKVVGGQPTKLVYSVLRYGSQCPDCGAPATKPHDWCELCQAQANASSGTFDAAKALDALLSGTVDAEDDGDE